MRFLITGGCGFIGSHIAELLATEDAEIRVLDNLSSGREQNIAHLRGRIEFIRGDVRDKATVERAVDGVDGVFHEAALVSVFDSVERPADCHEINVTGTLNVLNAARAAGVRRVVFAASAAAYGNDPVLPKKETMRPQPESPYAVSKIAGEHYLSVFAKLYGLQTASLRYFNVYGPRQDPSSPYSGVISKFTSVIQAGVAPVIFGDGLQTRDFVYVKDVAQANLSAMRSEKITGGEVINVASGKTVSLMELLNVLAALYGRQVTPSFKPARSGDVRHSSADISRAAELLNFLPQFTLNAGLRELVEHLNVGCQK